MDFKKLIFTVLIFACSVLSAKSKMPCSKDFYDLKSYGVDSVKVEISYGLRGSCVLFHINDNRIRCSIEGLFTGQNVDYELEDDSTEVYSFLCDYLIERTKDVYISKRKAPTAAYSDYCWVRTSVYIKGNDFIYDIMFDDMTSDEEVWIGEELLAYSTPFKNFINQWEENAALALGGEILKNYKSIEQRRMKNKNKNMIK